MSQRIENDHGRFKQVVRGKIKQNLRKYMSQGELIGKKGKDTVSIPVPRIDLPHFKFGDNQGGGVGQGDGEPGDPVGSGQQKPGQGGPAGSEPGEHGIDVEMTLDELADILGEELELPRIEPKGKHRIVTERLRYTGVTRVGPQSLRHFKRTFKEALKRQISMGSYDPKKPIIIPIREDIRYRTYRVEQRPESAAAVIYMMDVSGSMGDEQKEIVRIESFWIDTWLRRNYKGIETRYIIHDAAAREVDAETFLRTRESGGTMISSAYKLCAEIIAKDYPSGQWNIYPFHFSDGDNWSVDDTAVCLRVLRDDIIPAANAFCYGQVESPYGSGQFIKDLREHFASHEKVVLSEIANRDAIYKSIKEFLGKGN